MSLVGNLEDLGLGDILQIVSLSRKSGVLYLRGEPDADGGRAQGEIIFQNGQVIRATSSEATHNLGELLVARGVIAPAQLEEALSIQRVGGGRERVGNILIRHLHVPAERIQEAIRRQIEAIVYTFFRWPRGDFSFELKEADGALDKVDLEMRHMVLDAGLNPQFLAMEGTRLKDEVKRSGRVDPGLLPVAPQAVAAAEANGHREAEAPAPPSPATPDSDSLDEFGVEPGELEGQPRPRPAGTPGPAPRPGGTTTAPAEPRRLLPATERGALPTARPGGASPHPAAPRSEPPGRTGPGREDPRTEAPGGTRRVSEEPRRATPGGTSPAPDAPRTEKSGGTSRAPEAPRATPSLTEVDLTTELGLTRGASALGQPSSRGLWMLRAMISELTSPEAHGQITLLILRFAAEMMRRAVLFLVKDEEVVGLGQFGIELPGENPDRVVRGIRVPRSEPSTFAEVLKRPAAYKGPLGDSPWDARLAQALGGHRPAEIFCAPIASGPTIAALLYADNAPEEAPIGDTEALEIFLYQAGIQMEKALLERRIRELRDPGR